MKIQIFLIITKIQKLGKYIFTIFSFYLAVCAHSLLLLDDVVWCTDPPGWTLCAPVSVFAALCFLQILLGLIGSYFVALAAKLMMQRFSSWLPLLLSAPLLAILITLQCEDHIPLITLSEDFMVSGSTHGPVLLVGGALWLRVTYLSASPDGASVSCVLIGVLHPINISVISGLVTAYTHGCFIVLPY